MEPGDTAPPPLWTESAGRSQSVAGQLPAGSGCIHHCCQPAKQEDGGQANAITTPIGEPSIFPKRSVVSTNNAI
eukprot:scaffold94470_cov22-Prasinocladus_malaysianus.AAC.1